MGDDQELLRKIGSIAQLVPDLTTVADEHTRRAFYLKAIGNGNVSEATVPLIELILQDSDRLMAESVLVDIIDKLAENSEDAASFDRFLEPLDGLIGERAFPRRRVQEQTLFLQVREAGLGCATQDEILNGSNWLQLRIAAEVDASDVLELLARSGATRRIRNKAQQGLLRRGARSPGIDEAP